ncbi:MAG TPA: twin-arginine translocase TatA/TatE family subunit [Pseudonocardiaceae bacterium]
MFDLSPEKLFILAAVALFVLGPERLPAAASWLARTIRLIKNYATDANHQIRSELGPELDDIRQPLNDLRTDWTQLRSWRDPHTAPSHHQRDDSITPDRDPSSSGGWPLPPQQPATPPRQLAAGQRPPIDPDAT